MDNFSKIKIKPNRKMLFNWLENERNDTCSTSICAKGAR